MRVPATKRHRIPSTPRIRSCQNGLETLRVFRHLFPFCGALLTLTLTCSLLVPVPWRIPLPPAKRPRLHALDTLRLFPHPLRGIDQGHHGSPDPSGFPGYQCPYYQKQVHDFLVHASDFAAKKANVLLVYPGPPAELDQHAKDFLAEQELPANIHLVTDPDYKVTNLSGLRWDAPQEKAYPSIFILDRSGKILFETISREHGDRTTAEQVLDQIAVN